MAYDKKSEKNQYIALFKENLVSTYDFLSVARCKPILDYRSYAGSEVSKMQVNAGRNEGFELDAGNIIDTDEFLDFLNGEGEKDSKKVEALKSYKSKSPYIAVVLGENTKKKIYDKIREENGGSFSDNEVEEKFLEFALKIKECIKEISYTESKDYFSYRSSSNYYTITFTGKNIDEISEINKNVIKNALKDNTAKQKATVGSGGTPSRVPNRYSEGTVNSKKAEIHDEKNENMVELNSNEIIEKLKKKIKGQDKALEDVVYAVVENQEIIGSDIENAQQWKTNILIDGPSGTGKTYIIESVAENLGLPCYVTGITNYSGAGYKGADLSDILSKLLKATDGDLELAQKGIVALDEFDKLSVNEQNGNNNAMHQSIQDELLTYMSGTKVDVEYNGMTYEFDTSNLTFIAMGAFDRMHKEKREKNEQQIRETGVEAKREYDVTKEDYIEEGLRRELLGRFQTLTHTNELGIEELKDILLNAENSRLKKFKLLEKIHHKEIEVSDEAIDYIVKDAFRNNTGARALGDSIENIISVLNKQIHAPSIKKINVTPEIVKKALTAQKYQYIDPESRENIGKEMD